MTATTTRPYLELSLEELFAEADRIGAKYQDEQEDEIPDWMKEAIASAVDEANG